MGVPKLMFGDESVMFWLVCCIYYGTMAVRIPGIRRQRWDHLHSFDVTLHRLSYFLLLQIVCDGVYKFSCFSAYFLPFLRYVSVLNKSQENMLDHECMTCIKKFDI